MDILALASFGILVIGWLVAPGGAKVATTEHAAMLEPKAA